MKTRVSNIKFRQWLKKYNRFHYWGFKDGKWQSPLTDDKDDHPELSQQFIGYLDKEKMEIYQGDFVVIQVERLSSNNSTWYQKVNLHHGLFDLMVYIKPTLTGFKMIWDAEVIKMLEKPMGKEANHQEIAECRITESSLKDCQIIGNIFETPELSIEKEIEMWDND